MTDKKRYAVVTSFYVMANDEEDAIQRAKFFAAKQDTIKDDGCTVDEIYTATFGQLERKKIYPKNSL